MSILITASIPFPLSAHKFCPTSAAVAGVESQDLRQNGEAAKKQTKRVSPSVFQVFDVLGDGCERNRGGNCEEEKDGTVG